MRFSGKRGRRHNIALEPAALNLPLIAPALSATVRPQTNHQEANTVKCPHCRVSFHDNQAFVYLEQDPDGHWAIFSSRCASCKRLVLRLASSDHPAQNSTGRIVSFRNEKTASLCRPKGTTRAPVPTEVPSNIAEDYSEASLVLADSPKASAALSRRCLQHLLRAAAGVKAGDLANEIQQVLDSRALPSHLADSIDAIRNTGNFSAHPQKSVASGAILPVEPHEAEWNLDVLEALFDFYYVPPAAIAKKRAALNAKLGEAGKPPMK